ncbi:hypothetical protein JW905_06620, partial [bacterium]|nr:hypothetical protein [candidate division CSSED10-310 bacterium]
MQQSGLDRRQERSEHVEKSQVALSTAGDETLMNSMLDEVMERIAGINKEILEGEHRKAMRNVISPCAGHVVSIYARAGDTIDEFTPVLSVMESGTRFLDIYLQARADFAVEAGMPVVIYPFRSSAGVTTGRVAFVHPGYTQIPKRLMAGSRVQYARAVRIELPPGHKLLPGEIVRARIGGEPKVTPSLAGWALAQEPSRSVPESAGHPPADIRRMTLPGGLADRTRFEPSGICRLPGTERFLVVSDDTGVPGTPGDHAPILFLMDAEGNVNDTTLTLLGDESVNDLEAITPVDDESFILVSSQTISKNGKRSNARRSIMKIRCHDGACRVEKRFAFLDLLLASCKPGKLRELGMEGMEDDDLPVLNIEGAAYRDNNLYLGLKQPVSGRGAIIWCLRDIESVFQTGRMSPGQVEVFGYVDLGEADGRPRGISDLAFDDSGRLWALSTVPGVEGDDQTGGFHRLERFADGAIRAATLREFPGLKPEGLCFLTDSEFMIVFDTGQGTPFFCRSEVGR